MQRLLFILCLFVSLSTFSQNDTIRVKTLKGQIIHAETKKAFMLIAEKMNSGRKQTEKIGILNQAENKIKKEKK